MLPALQPGKYTVTVDAKGFKKAVSHDIIVTVTQIASVTIPLEIGSASETVTVSASQEVINTSSPSVTNIINTRQVVDLPLAGRNPVELAGLQGWYRGSRNRRARCIRKRSAADGSQSHPGWH
jgi:hypothetical protein